MLRHVTWSRGGIAQVMLLLAALANVRLLRAIPQYLHEPSPAPVAASIERYCELRGFLGPRAEVGYVTDQQSSAIEFVGAFGLARYALAPTRVKPSHRETMLVGDFRDPATSSKYLPPVPLRLLGDFGAGVHLYVKDGGP
jgi:hypothetical protein